MIDGMEEEEEKKEEKKKKKKKKKNRWLEGSKRGKGLQEVPASNFTWFLLPPLQDSSLKRRWLAACVALEGGTF